MVSALFALSLLSVTLGGTSVVVTDLPLLGCPGATALERSIQARCGRELEARPELTVEVQAAPKHLVTRLRGSDGLVWYEEATPVQKNDCPALADALALLVRSWLERDAAKHSPPLAPVAPAPPPTPAPPPAPTSTPPVEAPPAPPRQLVTALGGLSRSSAGTRGAAALSLETAFSSWLGLALQGRYEGLSGGESLLSASLSPRLTVAPIDRLHVDLLAGPNLGWASGEESKRLRWSWDLGLRGRWRLGASESPWSLVGGATLATGGRPELARTHTLILLGVGHGWSD